MQEEADHDNRVGCATWWSTVNQFISWAAYELYNIIVSVWLLTTHGNVKNYDYETDFFSAEVADYFRCIKLNAHNYVIIIYIYLYLCAIVWMYLCAIVCTMCLCILM